jgi:hypothetical protein
VATLGASALGFLAFAPATAFAATAPSNASNLGYTPITPARVCDTRSTTAAGGSDVTSGVTGQCANSGTALASGNELDVAIPTSVVPSGAQAVVLNVTAIGATAPGFLSVYAATGAAPSSLISNVNFAAGQDVANSVTVADNAGAVDVYFGPASPSASVNVAVDVQGYYMTPSSTTGDPYTAITPTRVADTRCGTSPAPSYCAGENLPSANSSLTTVGANSSINVAVAGVGSVPSTATAVSLNVTATDGSAASYLKVYPTGSTPAVTSNQNWQAGETLASQVVSKVGTNGDVSLYNFAGTVDYVVDVTGYYTAAGTSGSLFTSLGTPMRLADTRCAVSPTPSYCSAENLPSANSSLAAPSGGQSITVATGAPSGATSAALDVTDVMPATGNFLTAYPTGGTLNTVSTVNWVPGDTYNVVPNAAYATLSSSGDTSIYNGPSYAGAANVVVDMFGYFAPRVTNAVYSVTPTTTQTPTVSTSAHLTQGNTTYTASGLPANSSVDIALFPGNGPDAPATSNNVTTFTSAGGPGAAGPALGQGTTSGTSAFIEMVNGSPTAGGNTSSNTTTEVNGVSTGSGTLTFVLNSFAPDETVPVVFLPTNGVNFLELGANGQPTEAFGVGGLANFQALAAPAGAYFGYVVQEVNTAGGTFEACSFQGSSTCWTFSYVAPSGSTDTYAYDEPFPPVSLTQAQFVADLSGASPAFTTSPVVPGDILNITSYNSAGPSTFDYSQDVPAAPTGVTATNSAGVGVVVTWTAPPNQDVYSYTVDRSLVTNGVPGAPTAVGTVTGIQVNGQMLGTGGKPPATTFTDTSVAAGDTYVYSVTATSDDSNGSVPGPASAPSSSVTVPSAVVTSAPLSVSTAVGYCSTCTPGTLQKGDALAVTFNQPVSTPSSTYELTLTDGTNTGIVDSGNSTVALSNSNETVTYTLTSAVAGTPNALDFSTAPLEILENANKSAPGGVSNANGSWNLPGSGLASTALTESRVFTQPNISIKTPAAPTVNSETAPNTVNVTCDTAGDIVNVYTAQGVLDGSATCTATGKPQNVTTTGSFTNGTMLLVTETGTAAGIGTPYLYESLATQTGVIYSFSPTPIAKSGTLGDSQSVPVTLTTTQFGSPLANTTVYLTFTSTAATPGSATVTVNGSTTTLTSSPTAVATNSSGDVSISYTSSSATTNQTAGVDTITAANAPSGATATGSDTYTYVAPTAPTFLSPTATSVSAVGGDPTVEVTYGTEPLNCSTVTVGDYSVTYGPKPGTSVAVLTAGCVPGSTSEVQLGMATAPGTSELVTVKTFGEAQGANGFFETPTTVSTTTSSAALTMTASPPKTATAGTSADWTLTASNTDLYGTFPVTAMTGQSASPNGATATVPSSATFVGGVATVPVTLVDAAAQTLEFTVDGVTSTGDSSVTPTPGVASSGNGVSFVYHPTAGTCLPGGTQGGTTSTGTFTVPTYASPYAAADTATQTASGAATGCYVITAQAVDAYGNTVGASGSGETVPVTFTAGTTSGDSADGNTATWHGTSLGTTPTLVTLNASGQATIYYDVVAAPNGSAEDTFVAGPSSATPPNVTTTITVS